MSLSPAPEKDVAHEAQSAHEASVSSVHELSSQTDTATVHQHSPSVPYRQIRAFYDDKTITVYQAYSAAIAVPAVRDQNLCASPDFKLGRMTWIKPSWCWMMYRSNYSRKDARQQHILALTMSHTNFKHLLSLASLSHNHGAPLTEAQKAQPVRVQWDPERSATIGALPHRSIQIGISGAISARWAKEWVESIEDVTEKALALARAIEEEGITDEDELRRRGLMPEERVYDLEPELRKVLVMDERI